MRRIALIVGLLVVMIGAAADGQEVRELIYKKVDGAELRLFIHEPQDESDEPRTAIVLFHGGGWNGGRIEQFTPQAEHLAKRGMVAIRAEYRVRSRHKTTPYDAMADARDAMRWVRSHAEELKIDPERIAAGGGSAGGHLAACTALIAGEEPAEVSCVPNALVLFNPALDVSEETGVLGRPFGPNPRAGSPLHHVRENLPPTLILHGDADTTVPVEQARRFCEAMRQAGNVCELIEFPGRGHGFFNAGRGSQQDDAATLAAADRFLVAHQFLAPAQ